MTVPRGYTGHARDLLKASVPRGVGRVTSLGLDIVPNVKVYPRTDGLFVIFDKRLPLGEDAGVFESPEEAERVARRIYAHESGPKKGPAKQSAADEELFAAMKRAMANGFAKHEPAEDG